MLLLVTKVYSSRAQSLLFLRDLILRLSPAVLLFAIPQSGQFISSAQTSTAPKPPSASTAAPPTNAGTPQAAPSPRPVQNNFPGKILNTVVLDPAHGGTDPGARGTGGIRESEVVLEFAAQIRRALESQGLQVVQTRSGNENPSFDDRSTIANAQRGAVFVTIHISSTGLAGTARVYVNDDLPPVADPSGLIPWDQAQSPFLSLSHKLGDIVQSLLSQSFKGSPTAAQTAAVRQLRTTAAPAIAVELSSVSVEKREDLDRMAPAVAEAIARGIIMFKPSYVMAAATPALAIPSMAAPPLKISPSAAAPGASR
jgi:N-acetylmuramoyl-L-alanine amidase